jgi:outer membrane lipoprotein SlyB
MGTQEPAVVGHPVVTTGVLGAEPRAHVDRQVAHQGASTARDGQPLDREARQYMEARFGCDFSAVRVHTDDRAASTASVLQARAYTVENDIIFAPGAYRPETEAGRRLLAHELAHVAQQSNRVGAPKAKSLVSSRTDSAEVEADRVAVAVAKGHDARVIESPAAAIEGDWLSGAGIGGLTGAIVGGIAGALLGGGVGALAGAGIGLLLGAVVGGLIESRMRRGRWAIAQQNHDGPNYSSDVDITFTPDPERVDCPEIAFVQTVKFSDNSTNQSVETIPNYVRRRTATGWTLDRIDQRSHGWYGYNNNGLPGGNVTPGKTSPLTPARLHDSPSDVRPNSTFEFETAAICRSGPHANQLLGAFSWGFDVDAVNHLTSRATSESYSPSSEFNSAVRSWNLQAAGPAAGRNDPAQQQLGPFSR